MAARLNSWLTWFCRHKNASPLARAFAASALINAGRVEEAEKILDEALAAAPDDPRLLRREAKLHARLMQKEVAIAQFEKALALEPNNFETHRTYGWALLHFDRPADAAAHFHAAEELAGDMVEDLVAGLCLSARAQKNNTEALAAYRRLIELEPSWKGSVLPDRSPRLDAPRAIRSRTGATNRRGQKVK